MMRNTSVLTPVMKLIKIKFRPGLTNCELLNATFSLTMFTVITGKWTMTAIIAFMVSFSSMINQGIVRYL